MSSAPQTPEGSQCPICRAEVTSGNGFCGACGSKLAETPAQEIRSLNYLLAELSRWEEEGIVGHEQAKALRESYEKRREELRAQLAASAKRARPTAPTQEAKIPPAEALSQQHPSPKVGYSSKQPAQRAQTTHAPSSLRLPPDFPPRKPEARATRRALLEKLADPHTIRVLLYTGAAMLVVGVVIWLRDILYLKLQEPIVQATLLIIGTAAVTAAGWLTILRTRLLLTGRALTLTGSLLVPVNFWFLVRSGLIENNGRTYLVCAFCAALYALTASFLRERLYVYLASVAAVSTAWTFIYRVEREAFGLYALALMAASLVFLHLSHLFSAGNDNGQLPIKDGQQTKDNLQASLSSELWRLPLAHMALASAAFSIFFYMPLRLGASPSFANGIFRLRASEYDSSIAMLLFAAGAYATWFMGRHIFMDRRVFFYTLSVLCLFWTEFLAADGFVLPGSAQLLLLAATAFLVGLVARLLKSDALALAFYHASLLVTVALATVAYPVISARPTSSLMHSLILILFASTYAISGSPRFGEKERATGETLAHVLVAFATATVVVLQAMIFLRVGDPLLLAPSVSLGAVGILSFGASLRAQNQERARYFRAGLFALITSFALAALSSGFNPVSEVEIYTSPIAVLLLVVAYFFARRQRDEYATDTHLLLWAGSILLAAPMLIHALEYRLFLDVPAPWRDLLTLCAGLALLIFGVVGRLRAPVLVGAVALALELSSLALTSVDWLQIPLKVYLISTGALILLVWGLLEFRREQILLMRKRFNERRETAREKFGEWK